MNETYTPDFPTVTVAEGKIKLLVPDLKAYGVCPSDYAPSKAPVFYNPVMEFNRDLTILAFQAYQHIVEHEIKICEPLTATGIRGIRFAAEIRGVKKVVSGDINQHAAQLAAHNIALNNLQRRISIKKKDANRLLLDYSVPKKRFDIIDIDPFGTPVSHLDCAVQALRNRGLLAVTATDMAPLCGVHAKACVRKYGGKPMRTEYCHELAVRFLTAATATAAAKHEMGINVLFSHCSDHYIRVYAQVSYGAQKADDALKNMGYILHCFGCHHREIADKPFPETWLKCPECGTRMDYAGPLWVGNIFDSSFVERMQQENMRFAFKNSGKIGKFLGLIKGEANAPATYYVLDKLSGKLGLPAPGMAAFFAALKDSGYLGVPTHFNSRGVRTSASASAMADVLRKTCPLQRKGLQ